MADEKHWFCDKVFKQDYEKWVKPDWKRTWAFPISVPRGVVLDDLELSPGVSDGKVHWCFQTVIEGMVSVYKSVTKCEPVLLTADFDSALNQAKIMASRCPVLKLDKTVKLFS